MHTSTLTLAVTSLLFMTLSGCQSTHRVRGKPETSGFLGDYSKFREGGWGEASLSYVDSGANIAEYKKVHIAPIEVWVVDVEKHPKDEDLNMLRSLLHEQIQEELKKDYEIVGKPGPDTLTLRVAITEATKSTVFMDTVGYIPIGLGLNILKRLATGTYGFVGRAGIEGEVLDGSGNRIAAAVDRRSGTKAISKLLLTKTFRSWSDVKDAYAVWAKGLRKRLQMLREGKQ